MHLAILMTNTDESDFADRHPRDGAKFTALVHLVRPDWRLSVFAVKDGEFPDDPGVFDGLMITGSPASVRSGAAWVDRLFQVIRDAAARGQPIFGACFGHQAIAMALGGLVGDNPGGWIVGHADMQVVDPAGWARDLPAQFGLYGVHSEQVTVPPPGARILARSDACAVAGMAIGDRIYSNQYHPEMTDDFIAALIDEHAENLPDAAVAQGRASLEKRADRAAYAETIARFFEAAQ